ncbi:hypothetical protein Tco_1268953 [Tanacetum coccineum]
MVPPNNLGHDLNGKSVNETEYEVPERYSGPIKATDTLKKSFIPPRWRLLMAQIIQFLGGKTGGFDQISNKDAIILYFPAKEVNIDFAKLIWDEIVSKLRKKTKEKVIPYTRFLSLSLELKNLG